MFFWNQWKDLYLSLSLFIQCRSYLEYIPEESVDILQEETILTDNKSMEMEVLLLIHEE